MFLRFLCSTSSGIMVPVAFSRCQEIIRKQPYNYKTDVWSSFVTNSGRCFFPRQLVRWSQSFGSKKRHAVVNPISVIFIMNVNQCQKRISYDLLLVAVTRKETDYIYYNIPAMGFVQIDTKLGPNVATWDCLLLNVTQENVIVMILRRE